MTSLLVPPRVSEAHALAQVLDNRAYRSRWLTGWRGWLTPISAAAVGAAFRWPNLGTPRAFVFDETYYAKDAWMMTIHGIEWDWKDKIDDSLIAARGDSAAIAKLMADSASYVVHPPAGKWVISLGEMMFGMTPFGWRFMVCLLGTLAVLMTARLAQVLTRSTTVAALAGLFMAIDGTAIVMSRTAVLDGILMFFVLAATLAVARDHQHVRARLARILASPDGDSALDGWRRRAVGLGARPWLWVAGLLLGAAAATKWSALWHIALLGLVVLAYGFATRRLITPKGALSTTLLRDSLVLAGAFLIVPTAVYIASFTGWFMSPDSYEKNWAADVAATGISALLPVAARSWLHYHRDVWNFHVTLTSHHDYQANAWSWPVMGRPTSFWYGEKGSCASSHCAAEVTSMGNPIIWWAGLVAVLHQAWLWLSTRSRSALFVVALWFAGWFPWLLYQHRTIFFFYAIVMVPFTAIALAMSLTHIARGVANPSFRVRIGFVSAVVLLAVAMTWFFLPVWTGQTITYDHWRWRMWFDTWI